MKPWHIESARAEARMSMSKPHRPPSSDALRHMQRRQRIRDSVGLGVMIVVLIGALWLLLKLTDPPHARTEGPATSVGGTR